ncbi:MAG: OmpA family protein [Acidobacteriales bacterium]|nr:OmpA family protein [Terriglobales bacterium]
MTKHLAVLLLAALSLASAQTQPYAPAKADAVIRTTKAMHYRPGGTSKIQFQGTELMQRGSGEAKIEGKKTNIAVDAKFEGMEDATKFGLEYLTYVLWAVSPQGRAVNLGEVGLDHGKGHVKAFTDLQTFGIIVTAEPYSAVTQPGNMVVMENVFPAGAGGEEITAKYELLRSGTYSANNTRIEGAIFGIDSKTPLALFEARNAVRIARVAGAERYAAAIFSKVELQLRQAEEAYRQKQTRTSIEAAAREAAQTAEESRVMAVKQKAEEEAQAEAAAERRAAEERAARAREEAEAQTRARQEADTARAQAEAAKAEAQKAAEEAARQKQEAEKAKAEALAQQQVLAVEAEKARQSAGESQKLRQQAEQAAAESDRLRQQAEKEKQEMRARLLQQLNSVLATRDTARGLIANMSDVLFKSGSFELLPGARERLAKVSGIVLAYQGLRLSVEGHTDSIGTDEYNRRLSEQRAGAVRDYLVQQGISSDAITASGFGKTEPVASNDTPEGRQQNRRVELVVSGNAIGNTADAGAEASASSKLQK